MQHDVGSTSPAQARAFRCSDSARGRADPLVATAVPARRFLLVEVPGPWGRVPLATSRLDPGVAAALGTAANEAGARLLLVRRPGRHPDAPHGQVPHRALAWALADVRPEVETVAWGTYGADADLLGADLARPLTPADRASGPQRVALVCTHGTRDVCCAVRGRPVAEAARAVAGWDVWECTHVGGDRFAANAILLPTGDMFGGLDAATVPAVLDAHVTGRLARAHHRGRCGTRPEVQAVAHLAGVALGEDRAAAVEVGAVVQVAAPDGAARAWRGAVAHEGTMYDVLVSETVSEPARLSCSVAGMSRARLFGLASLARAGG